ncbi:uncharacterized protein MYCFIDRAFT_83190 [Pseudocercospora fijiensis CIRAD86]|uniref:Uncharacterized protein n=1 Tax=Pseudocercospora fijiensis (strain CIRAD86) TaxID=383855 RepID=M2ZDR3_PSEFD|nr:uncharacterized protein MYCFIDRAFT_83190 [Pseudocercospora fijiensis CIRAD86]EME77234.1 hypothetical protein MYCFIDRAFT_83190 [Pseudocercospora fijiensis CIRAD86]
MPPPIAPFQPPTIPPPKLKDLIDGALITNGYINEDISTTYHAQDLHAAIRYLAPRIQPMKSELANISNELSLEFQTAQNSARAAGNHPLVTSLQTQAAMSQASTHVTETVQAPPEAELRRTSAMDSAQILTKLVLCVYSGEASVAGAKRKIEELRLGRLDGRFSQKVGVQRF